VSSQVFYRKWRPQTLSEVAGQEHVTCTLRHALESGRVAHAYLFCGPRGTGKTSTGRILAKAVNCLNNGRGEPCNRCEMCQAITQGRALDVIEIDAASNRGIDEIRDLREKINFAPNQAKYKVYIIDEVHMLTEPASNALLKTLEEPPSHALLVLATTEPHKLLPTILSRCQRFDFRRLSQTAIISKLSHICQQEGIDIESGALRLLARCASGSLRDAENLLEQLLAYYGPRITLSQVQDMLGITPNRRVEELAQHIAHKNLAAGLATLNHLVREGQDLAQFHRELVEYLRSMLLVKSGAEETLELTPEELEEVKKLASCLSLEELTQAVKLFGQLDFRSQDYSPLPLELALVECLLPAAGKQERAPAAEPEATLETGSPPPQVGEPDTLPAAEETAVESPSPEKAESAAPRASPSVWERNPELDYIRRHWNEFINTLKGLGSNRNLDALLRGVSEPIALEGDTLVLAIRYPFQYDKISDPKYRHLVEKKLEEKFGTPSKIRCLLKPGNRQRAINGHLVRAAQELGGRVIDVEEK
jgi:DNA polymerase-3 subunit gamma/tau